MLKKITLIVLLLILSADFCVSQNLSVIFYDDITSINNIWPRIEASSGEDKLLNYIEESLDSKGISYNKFDFEDSEIKHSFSSCIEVTINGEKKDTIILAIPINHSIDEMYEYSGTINIALALEILRQVQNVNPVITLKILFLSAEFGEDPAYPLGSNLFLENFYPDYPVSVIYLNLKRIPSRLIVRCGAKGIVSPHWFLDFISESLNSVNLKFLIRGNENQLFRMGLTDRTSIIEPYLYEGYPSAVFEGEYNTIPFEYKELWPELFINYFWTYTGILENGFPSEWDQHYLFFQISDFYLILGEEIYIILILILFGIIILYILFNSKQVLFHLTKIIRKSWIIMIYLITTFVFFYVSTLILNLILILKNNELLWAYWPILFLLFKAVIILFLFTACTPLIKKLPFPKHEKFFTVTPVFIIFINIIILSIINISFAYYFLWSFVMLFLYNIVEGKRIKIFFFLLSPIWLIKVTLDFFLYPETEFCRVFLLSPVIGSLLFAIFIFPYLLFSSGLKYTYKILLRKRKILRGISTALLAVVFVSLVTVFIFFSPFNKKNPQEVIVTNRMDLNLNVNDIEISSLAPLGKIYFWDGENDFNFTTQSKKYHIPVDNLPQILEIETVLNEVLDRKIITQNYHLKGNPYRISITIESENEFILYDSNLPFERNISGKSYTIDIGKKPPNPFILELTFPKGVNLEFNIEIEYIEMPFKFEFSGDNKKILTYLIATKNILLQT